MKNSKKSKWVAQIYRPELPEGWKVEEQIDTISYTSTTFIKFMKTHHNGKPEKVYVIFNEHDPKTQNFNYSVRGGRHARPDENLKYFNNIKDATSYLIYVMESTDKWCKEINSEKHIKAYNDRIAKYVAEEERRKKAFEDAMADNY